MMHRLTSRGVSGLFLTLCCATACVAAPAFTWSTVVNDSDYMPTDVCDPVKPTAVCRHFNSYNEPSVNISGLVVMRARSKGGQGTGEPVQGIYTRNMSVPDSPIVRILDRATVVPQPNNLDSTFGEPPAFPRIGINTDTIATRANQQPVWAYSLSDQTKARTGNTGVYTNPFGPLIAGASTLGSVPGFSFFQVPELPGTAFDVFPGSPSVAGSNVIVFKGNYTEGETSRTGVYFRRLNADPIRGPRGQSLGPAGGNNPFVSLANTKETLIPGTDVLFGSTAPPSAAGNEAVFAGFDNEDDPTVGGIYLAPLVDHPTLTTLVAIGGQVPGEPEGTGFQRLGEALSFDGRFVAFWGAWDVADSKTLILHCPTEGNKARIAYCLANANDFPVQVPVHQGIFVHDDNTGKTYSIAKTGATDNVFSDFLYWNYSGHVPGTGENEEPGESARWRSSPFLAISGPLFDTLFQRLNPVRGPTDAVRFRVAFEAREGQLVDGAYVTPVDGIYLSGGPGSTELSTLVATGMDGTRLDPQAIDSSTGKALAVTEMGIERDGFRGNNLVIDVRMGNEEDGWGGIYLARFPVEGGGAIGPCALLTLGVLGFMQRHRRL